MPKKDSNPFNLGDFARGVGSVVDFGFNKTMDVIRFDDQNKDEDSEWAKRDKRFADTLETRKRALDLREKQGGDRVQIARERLALQQEAAKAKREADAEIKAAQLAAATTGIEKKGILDLQKTGLQVEADKVKQAAQLEAQNQRVTAETTGKVAVVKEQTRAASQLQGEKLQSDRYLQEQRSKDIAVTNQSKSADLYESNRSNERINQSRDVFGLARQKEQSESAQNIANTNARSNMANSERSAITARGNAQLNTSAGRARDILQLGTSAGIDTAGYFRANHLNAQADKIDNNNAMIRSSQKEEQSYIDSTRRSRQEGSESTSFGNSSAYRNASKADALGLLASGGDLSTPKPSEPKQTQSVTSSPPVSRDRSPIGGAGNPADVLGLAKSPPVSKPPVAKVKDPNANRNMIMDKSRIVDDMRPPMGWQPNQRATALPEATDDGRPNDIKRKKNQPAPSKINYKSR